MTGIPQFNIPAFDRQAKRLRDSGYEVVSPTELDSPEMRAAAYASLDGKPDLNGGLVGQSWGEVLGRDVIVVADRVDGVVVLPGWAKSRGARLEVFVALLCKKPIYVDVWYDTDDFVPMLCEIPEFEIVDDIARSFQ